VFALVLVLFRVNYLNDALLFYRDILSIDMLNDLWVTIKSGLFHHGGPLDMPVVSAYWADWFLIAAIVAGDILVRNGYTLAKCPVSIQAIAYNAGLALIIFQWMSTSVAPPFLYYKF
jgi:hypothetical protein